jgi:uncharacterized repeat protein (TIGR03803 family)
LKNIDQMAMSILASLFVLGVVLSQAAPAQTFSVLYNFDTGHGGNGANPQAGLTMDRGENLYGTASTGGTGLSGGVFKLSHRGSGWIYSPLYLFSGGSDGGDPEARVIIGPNGSLYGTTKSGGSGRGGTVFNLQPPVGVCKTVSCPWRETVLYNFSGPDGSGPVSEVVFDQTGNLYGTTAYGGTNDYGVAYELTPSGNGWTESVMYAFGGGTIGYHPSQGFVLDGAGSLYSTAGEEFNGSVYQLSLSLLGWTANAIFTPQGGDEGLYPGGGVIFDTSGNLYGSTGLAGAHNGGTVFKLTPSNGSWTPAVLYSFTPSQGPACYLVMDQAGNIYGTTYQSGAYNQGSVFKLTPGNGGWTYSDLHDFTGGADGSFPCSQLTLDANGNIFGTAPYGGAYSGGVIFEITP